MTKNKRAGKIIFQMVEKIILFGSYAYGKPTQDSDIDMLIVKRTKKKSMDRWFFF
jgi:predicted nucleotidyltransferase